MKTRLLIALFVISRIATAQNTWVQKTPLPGLARLGAVGFSIGSKGYIGTGYYNPLDSILNDFWEWDAATNAWTQKADFGGGNRGWAMGSSSGANGYIGLGTDLTTGIGDFWQYDTTTNSWTQKALFGGAPAGSGVCFSIGSNLYILGHTDFWEYNTGTDVWTQKASYPGAGISAQSGFSIGNKGYVGTGASTSTTFVNDFWEYNPALDLWTQMADFGGLARCAAVGFSIGGRGYIGTGSAGQGGATNLFKDFWEYNPSNNTWKQRANFGGTARSIAVGFSMGSKGYIGTGWDASSSRNRKDFWEYTPDTISTGLEELGVDNTISTYPNPFSKETTLYTDIVLKDASMTLYNTLGLQVKQIQNISGQTINIQRDNLPAGLYFIRITQGDKIIATHNSLLVTDN